MIPFSGAPSLNDEQNEEYSKHLASLRNYDSSSSGEPSPLNDPNFKAPRKSTTAMRGIVGDALTSKKRSVKSPMPSAPDANNDNVEMIDTSANRKPQGNGENNDGEKSLSSDSDEDQWKIAEPTPKKKDVPKPAPKKKKDVPEAAS